MKKNYFRSFLFSSLVILGVTSINAQEKENLIKQKIAGSNGNPTLIVFNKSSTYNLSQSKQILKEQLSLKQNDDFKKLKSETDKIGFVHEKHQQYFKGVKVEFGTYTLHSKKGRVESISGEYYESNNVNVSPKLSKGQAFQAALSHIGAQSYLWEDVAASKELGYKKPEGELVLLPVFDNLKKKGDVEKLKLAYKFEIFTIVPLGGADVYIDAQTGRVLFYNARVKHADNFGHDGRSNVNLDVNNTDEAKIETLSTALIAGSAQTRYSGTQSIETTLNGSYTLNDASRKVYTRNANNLAPAGSSLPYITNYTEFSDNDNNWTAAEYDNVNKDNAALDAHWGAMKTYDYWQNVHGRNSYDNAGAQLRSYVHVDNNYDNAFWFLNVMSYGDGSSDGTEGNGFFDALTSIDVAAHEIGHAVTEFTANLAYQRESGAMNEGFSDIWGAAVEHFAKGNGNDAAPDASIWLIGDEIDRRTGSAALRSMSNPTLLGQPDTYGGTNWVDVNCGTPTSTNDYCGVHTNSGVLNHWFYLLTVGGSGINDIGGNYNVSGIGMAKAGNIAYRLESVYLSANSTYADARTSGIQSAIDLYGAASAEEIAVTNAWHAVGVGNAYGDTSANYCASASTNVNDEYISRVQLNTIDNVSTGQFYSDFTAVSTDLTKSTQYTITVTPTWAGTVYSEGYAVWIDYNNNGDFTDAGELVFSQAATQTTPVSGSFTVPATATDGATRMRVSLKYNGIPTACEAFTYGEVEDYTVNIGATTGGDIEAPTAPTSLAASAITETTAILNWTASTDNVGVTGYEVFQGATSIGTVTATTTNITGLTASTNYTFTVKATDAAGNVSAASNSVNVTTNAAPDTQAPSAPGALAASNITQTSVDLSWSAATDNIGVTGYDVYQNGVNVSTVTGITTSIAGLTASTSYSFYVIAKDAAGNISSASNTVNATTLSSGGGSGCTGGIVSFPYSEGFENTLGAWTQSTTDDIDWTIDANGTPSSGTGPTSAVQGTYYLYVEASGNGTGYPNKQAILNSPCFDLSAETDATFSFKYHMLGDPDMGTIALEASNDNGTTWTSLWSDSGNKGTAWLTANVNLSAYVGGSVQLRFNRITGGTWKADIAIDDISLSGGGTTGGNTAVALSITFDNYPEETSWEIQDSASLVVASGGTYASQADGSTLNINVDLPTGCYSFVMKDSYGDGMCCSFGNGSYTLTDTSNNLVLANGGSFTSSQTTGFCVGGAVGFNGINSLTVDTSNFNGVEFEIYPNPVSGILNMSLLGAEAQSYKITNMLGQVVLKGAYSKTIDVSKLHSDIYVLQIYIGEKTKVKRFLKK